MKTQWKLWFALVVLPAAGALGQEGTAMPGIEHSAVTRAVTGQPLTLTATIRSTDGVFQPALVFRHVGELAWTKVPLLPSGGDVYTATLPGATVQTDLEYYLETFDNDGNGPARAGSPDAPLHVTVAAAATARQFTAQPAATGSAAPPPVVTEEKSAGISGKAIGGIVSGAVGLAGLGVGIAGWVIRNEEVNNSNNASPNVRSVYQTGITQYTVVGAVGTGVGVVGVGIGIWLLVAGLSSGSADASKDVSSGLSVSPVPGGAMAAYQGRF